MCLASSYLPPSLTPTPDFILPPRGFALVLTGGDDPGQDLQHVMEARGQLVNPALGFFHPLDFQREAISCGNRHFLGRTGSRVPLDRHTPRIKAYIRHMTSASADIILFWNAITWRWLGEIRQFGSAGREEASMSFFSIF